MAKGTRVRIAVDPEDMHDLMGAVARRRLRYPGQAVSMMARTDERLHETLEAIVATSSIGRANALAVRALKIMRNQEAE